MSETKRSGGRLNLGLFLPLLGALLFWYLILAGAFTENLLTTGLWPGIARNSDLTNVVHPMTYVSLVSVAVLVIFSLLGRRSAAAKLAADPQLRLNRNTYTFTTAAIITALIAAAIYTFAIFIGNQMWGTTVERDPMIRLLQLYIPVILGAAVLLLGILRAFVLKPKGGKK
ncbi:MAG: hypothetical protein RL670_885 [Actinomycetota bacterium]|jgi:heme/copper-type cytochrome/quinol oxidase subunit 2